MTTSNRLAIAFVHKIKSPSFVEAAATVSSVAMIGTILPSAAVFEFEEIDFVEEGPCTLLVPIGNEVMSKADIHWAFASGFVWKGVISGFIQIARHAEDSGAVWKGRLIFK